MRRAVPHADRRPSNVPPPRALRSSGHRPPTRHPFLHPHRALSPAVLPLSPNPHPLHLAPPAPAFVPRAPRGPARRPPPPFPRRTPRGPTAPTPTGGRRQTGGWVGGTLLRPHVLPPVTCCTSTAPARSEKVAQCRAAALYRHGGSAPRPAPPGQRRMAARGRARGYVRARCGRNGPPPLLPPPPSQQRAAVGLRVGLGGCCRTTVPVRGGGGEGCPGAGGRGAACRQSPTWGRGALGRGRGDAAASRDAVQWVRIALLRVPRERRLAAGGTKRARCEAAACPLPVLSPCVCWPRSPELLGSAGSHIRPRTAIPGCTAAERPRSEAPGRARPSRPCGAA